MKPYRSREYLRLVYAPGVRCAKCGAQATDFVPIDPAHYSGLYSDRFGKGGAQKAADLVCCPLCRSCHRTFDLYEMGNDDARAAEFMAMCWAWLLRNISEGHVAIVLRREGLPVEEGVPPGTSRSPSPSRRRKRGSQCTPSSKTVPRRGWLA